MADHNINNDWVDRYIRDELNAEEEIAFEEKLLEDPELQQELEAALAIKETFKRTDLITGDVVDPSISTTTKNSWTPFAMAASVLLAVASTTLLWRANIETDGLRQQLEALQQPRTSVLNVPVDIMRSAGNSTPDVIIQKPESQGVIVLDVELSSRFSQLDQISFELSEENGERFLAWSSSPSPDGRASVVLNSESITDGRVTLAMSAPGSQQKETRLLEFRAAIK